MSIPGIYHNTELNLAGMWNPVPNTKLSSEIDAVAAARLGYEGALHDFDAAKVAFDAAAAALDVAKNGLNAAVSSAAGDLASFSVP